MSDLLNNYGARIKSIYIELKNYSYYHNPSGIENPDKRFIGRKEMRKKLKNLLTKSETNSGTYLVTGFRGMGKTSFVNQVLSEIKSTGALDQFFQKLFGLSLSLWILSFFSVPYVIGFSILIIFLLMNVIVKGEDIFKNYKNSKELSFLNYSELFYKKYKEIFLYPFNTPNQNNPKLILSEKIIRLFTLGLIANIILIFSTDILNIYENTDYNIEYRTKFISYLGILVLYLFFLTPLLFLYKNKVRESYKKPQYYIAALYILLSFLIFNFLFKWKLILTISVITLSLLFYFFKEDIKRVVHSLLNNNEIIPIHINLGKEKLSEEDILRLLAFGLADKYKKVVKPFYYFKRATWTIIISLLVYAIAISGYYHKDTHKLINQLKSDIHLEEYFPSQTFYRKEGEKNITEYFETAFNNLKEKNNSVDFYTNYAKSFGTGKTPDNYIKKITYSLDYFFTNTFYHFTHPLLSKKSKAGNIDVLSYSLRIDDDIFHYFPFYDYFFIIYLFIFFIISRWIINLKIWGINHKIIQNKLDELVDNINAVIYEENKKELSLSFPKFFNNISLPFGKNKKKEFPVAGAREIEMSLLSILSDIESLSTLRFRPRFVFIFDELDKIQPRDEVEEEVSSSKQYVETEWVKRRQDTIRKILTNLKHFFNSAKAKFVFIAGREMYDAALADISDREALIGSMFHEIIYINSFYKDPADERLSDITSMTERYIAQFLIPDDWVLKKRKELSNFPDKRFEYNFYWFNRYLEDTFTELSHRERIKITVTLQDFVSYVSYRSNGAPKKITRLLEEYITSYPDEKDNFSSTIITKGDKRNLYLHFSYYDQYIFTMGKYLFNPFVLAVNKYISQFEDKLLVSTSFLLNHLYKFHKVGFSYKTLELTPEIIAIYKAPELRDFILRLINFLNRTHIRKIISGLYDFKFRSQLEREISYISKISEKESAALNFTLDESLDIKSIFRTQLKNEKKYWKAKRELSNNIETIVTINSYLGDLNFNDNQFLKAIHFYNEALISFKKVKIEKTKPDTMINYIRIYLKLGLSYEMVKNMSEALLSFETVFYEAKKYVDKCIKDKGWSKFQYPRENPPLLVIQRLFYQALLAKLFIIEKNTIKSLTKNQINANIQSFKSVVNKYLEPEQQFLLKTEYYNKIGDLLFYKNGILFGKSSDEDYMVMKQDMPDDTNNQEPNPECYNQKSESLKELINIQKDKSNKEHLFALPVNGYKYYMISLANLINIGVDEKFVTTIRYFDIKQPEKSEKLMIHYLTDFLYRGAQKSFPLTRRAFYLASANALSDAGDTILILATAQLKNKKDNNEKLSDYLDIEKLKRVLYFDMYRKENPVYTYEKDNKNHINKMYCDILNEDVSNVFKTSIENLQKKLNEIYFDLRNSDFRKFAEINNKIDNIKNTKKIKDIYEHWIWVDNKRNEMKKVYRKFYNANKEKIKTDPEIKNDLNNFLKLLEIYKRLKIIFANERIEIIRKKISEDIYKDYNRFHIALRYLIISAGYFLKSEEYKEYVFQLTKIMHIFKVIIPELKDKIKDEDKEKLLDLLKERIVEKAIRYNFKAYKNQNKAEEEKLINSFFDKDEINKKFENIFHTATSAAEDVKEVIILYKEIELMLKTEKEYKIEETFITPYTTSSLESNRLFELNYKNHFNYKILEQMYDKANPFEKLKSLLNEKEGEKIIKSIRDVHSIRDEELEFVILDSMFALFKMYRSVEIFGLSYIHNHSWFASIFRRLGFWTQLYQAFVKETGNAYDTVNKLKKLIGKEEMNDLNPFTYYEKALTHSYSIYSTHFEGKEYYDMISEMNYLDDDFNDTLYHFSATVERMVINLGIIERHIDELKEFIRNEKKQEKIQEYNLEFYIDSKEDKNVLV